jgi:hypothetical protein
VFTLSVSRVQVNPNAWVYLHHRCFPLQTGQRPMSKLIGTSPAAAISRMADEPGFSDEQSGQPRAASSIYDWAGLE